MRFDTKFLIALVPYLTFLFSFPEVQMAGQLLQVTEGSSFKAVVVVARLIHGSRVAYLGPLYSALRTPQPFPKRGTVGFF